MVNDTIFVKAWGETIAKVIENNFGTYDFIMNPDNKLPFSKIKMPTMGKPYNFSNISYQHGLPGLVSDTLPGQYGNAVLNEFFMQHLGRLPSPLEKLQILADNTMGALTYIPEILSEKKTDKVAIMDMSKLYEETKRVLHGESNFELEKIIAISNSAAGGAQPKATVGLDFIHKKMYVGKKSEPLPSDFVHAIVKFDNLTYKRDSAVRTFYDETGVSKTKTEYIYSLLANKCGILMPKTYLIEDPESGIHFGVERFDIKTNEDKTTERIHMHSLSGLVHHHTGETTYSYENIFKVGTKLNIPHADMENLFKTMVFNIVFANRDDHTKNFSYLMDKNGVWTAAPAYDLTFAPSKRHQMLFGLKSVDQLTRIDLTKMANTYRIKNAEEIIDLIVDVKHSSLIDLSTQHGIQKIWSERVLNLTSGIDAELIGKKYFQTAREEMLEVKSHDLISKSKR
jgi:serine/threonine-protein kinase HipA